MRGTLVYQESVDMKPVVASRIMALFISLAIVLSLGTGILLIRQELIRRHGGIEYQAFQVMTGIVDLYYAGGSFDPGMWPDVAGFGMYELSGSSAYRYGSAPEYLETAELREALSSRAATKFSASSIVIIRKSGSIPPMRGDARDIPRSMLDRMLYPGHTVGAKTRTYVPRTGGIPGGLPRPPLPPAVVRNGPDRYVFIELNVSHQLGSIRLFIAAASTLLAILLAILCLLIVYSRKLAAYRAREQSMANLVQLGEAARTLAHEIKNPLGVIRVQCATLARTLPEERQKNIRMIQEETDRLAQLTDRIRDFLHNSAGSPKPCDAAGFLGQCRARYADRLFVDRWAGPTVTIIVDPDRMMQVLDNLVANAIEATDSAGAPVSLPVLSLSVQKGRALFSVADRGSGVDPENRSRLFELFFTTKPRGSGIGLALSRRFMEQAGGSLVYAEQSGGGSVFTAAVPCAAPSRRR